MMKSVKLTQYLRMVAWVVLALGACSLFSAAQTQPVSLGVPDLPTSVRLKYAVLESRGDVVPCGAVFRQDREAEIAAALQIFPEIYRNTQLLQLIAGDMDLNPEAMGDDERVLVYCEYQKLQGIRLEPWKDKYRVINIAQEQSAGSTDQSQKGWTSVDLYGYVMSLSVQTAVPAVSSVPLRDIKPLPPAPLPAIKVSRIELPKLRYSVLDGLRDVRYCPPRIMDAQQNRREIEAFSQIQADQETFKEISAHLHLKPDTQLSDQQKLLVYREYEKLHALTFDFLVSKYQFMNRQYVGLVNQEGKIKILKFLPHNNSCPV
jgi:hypothetical protein